MGATSRLRLRRWLIGSPAVLWLSGCLSCEAMGPAVQPGRVAWRADGSGTLALPAFDGSTVFFVGRTHELVAVDKFTGARRWSQVSGDGGAETRGSSAIVVGGIVAMGDLDIHGFDRATGSRRWDFHPQDGYYPGFFRLETDGTAIYAGSPSGRAYAIDGATGQPRWTAIVADDDNTSVFAPTVHDGVVYLCVRHFTNPATGGLVALSAATGAKLWATDFPPEPPYQHSGCSDKAKIAGDVVIGVSAFGYVYGLDRLTGDVRWTIPRLTDLPPGALITDLDTRPIAVWGRVLVVGSATGYVAAYDVDSRNELWRARADRGSASRPLAIDAERVYAIHDGGQLAAFRLTDGKLLWIAGDGPSGSGFPYTPAVDDSVIYAGGYNGLYALRKQ